jgi:hypothetical protein
MNAHQFLPAGQPVQLSLAIAPDAVVVDTILVIDQGRIVDDETVDVPRPRPRGSGNLAALEGAILRQLLMEAREADA